MKYPSLRKCRDFQLIESFLNSEEMEEAEKLVQSHDLEMCGCEENADGFHCLAGRWIEGLMDTKDFLNELTIGHTLKTVDKLSVKTSKDEK